MPERFSRKGERDRPAFEDLRESAMPQRKDKLESRRWNNTSAARWAGYLDFYNLRMNALECQTRASYFRRMKRISILLLAWALCAAPAMRAEDAATEERLNKLSGQIEDLIAGQKTLRDQVAELSRQLQTLRDEQGKPNSSYANHDELARLADAIKEVDRKRVEDNEKIHADLLKLGNTLSAPLPPSKKKHESAPPDTAVPDKTTTPDKG